MSPDSVFWLGRAWYTLPAISVKVRESLVQFPGDCTCSKIYNQTPCDCQISTIKCATTIKHWKPRHQNLLQFRNIVRAHQLLQVGFNYGCCQKANYIFITSILQVGTVVDLEISNTGQFNVIKCFYLTKNGKYIREFNDMWQKASQLKKTQYLWTDGWTYNGPTLPPDN